LEFAARGVSEKTDRRSGVGIVGGDRGLGLRFVAFSCYIHDEFFNRSPVAAKLIPGSDSPIYGEYFGAVNKTRIADFFGASRW
jgi:hypothetical protein